MASTITQPKFSKDLMIDLALFLVVGLGPSFVATMTITQETPFLQRVLPQGLCVAMYINAASTVGIISVAFYYLLRRFVGKWSTPTGVILPGMLVLASFSQFLTAGVYQNAWSLYFCTFLAGLVGNLSSVVMNAWLMTYKNDCISASRAGGSFGMLLTALIAMGQNPGSSNERFSMRIYMIIFGIILSLSLPAYMVICAYKRGLRDPQPTSTDEEAVSPSSASISANSSAGWVDSSMTTNAIFQQQTDNVKLSASSSNLSNESNNTATAMNPTIVATAAVTINADSTIPVPPVSEESERNREEKINEWWVRPCISFISIFVNIDEEKWLPKVLPLMLTVAWTEVNTWAVISVVAPFAFANATTDGGAMYLAVAYEAGAVAQLAADVATIWIKLPFRPLVFVFTALSFLFYAASAGSKGLESPAAAAGMSFVFIFCRFIDEFIVTSTYRIIATEFPLDQKEAAARAVGACDMISQMFIGILSTVIVAIYASC